MPHLLKISVASDHAGVDLKADLITRLKKLGYTITDLGPAAKDSVDYPDYADALAKKVEDDSEMWGILICGSGIGMCMRANRYPHIRAALCTTTEMAKLARAHNDANVLCLGARITSVNDAWSIAEIFLNTLFEGGRHAQRVAKLGRPTKQ